MAETALVRLGMALKESEGINPNQAWSMPKEYYTAPALLALERERLFGTERICLGRGDGLRNPGDFITFQQCDEPGVAIRGDVGRIRVLSNVCRHRGAVIASGSGHTQRLVCPYHHWSHDRTGALAAAPRMEPRKDFDQKSCRLPEFAREEWHGFVFTNLVF